MPCWNVPISFWHKRQRWSALTIGGELQLGQILGKVMQKEIKLSEFGLKRFLNQSGKMGGRLRIGHFRQQRPVHVPDGLGSNAAYTWGCHLKKHINLNNKLIKVEECEYWGVLLTKNRNKFRLFLMMLKAWQHKSTNWWNFSVGRSPPFITYAISEVRTNGARSLRIRIKH